MNLVTTFLFVWITFCCVFGRTFPNKDATVIRLRMQIVGVLRNEHFAKLQAGYLFPEIARRREAYSKVNKGAKIISLGIGDTTLPVPMHILSGLVTGASKLGTADGYTGYGAEQGMPTLRAKIAGKLYNNRVFADEVFVSDGAKCDIARLQLLFGSNIVMAVQDPSYPVYVDTSVMLGQTGSADSASKQYNKIVYLACNPSNNFFPDVSQHPRADVYYICSPNNPTGAVATRENLEDLVQYCRKQGSILVYDAAYASFIRTPGVPKSIYEIDGAREVAIEVNSFSKYAGFTGVRLGWTVVPAELKFSDGTPVRNDWNRLMATAFNGASSIAQYGGLACLDNEGLAEIEVLIDYYLDNARLLKTTFEDLGFHTYGGVDAPYIFVHMKGQGSWEAFSDLLETVQVVTIPGAGFGPAGEGYLRLSAFASKENCVEACARIRNKYSTK